MKAEDRKIVRDAVGAVSLPLWAESCDRAFDKCSATWKQVVGPVIGLQ